MRLTGTDAVLAGITNPGTEPVGPDIELTSPGLELTTLGIELVALGAALVAVDIELADLGVEVDTQAGIGDSSLFFALAELRPMPHCL